MRSIRISLFTDRESDPIALDGGHCWMGIQVDDVDELGRKDVYDFRLESPVREHVLGEVTQLVSDLVSSSCQQLGGLQPALF
jgi:hypothetical protein